MSAERSVAEAIDARAGEVVALATELIGFDTTVRGEPDEPAREERELQERLAERLRAAGPQVELIEPEAGALDGWRRQVPQGLGFAGRP
jgi:acetylornithine deacetylase/succinyl-diaminopimelate desuccinylase-like protein